MPKFSLLTPLRPIWWDFGAYIFCYSCPNNYILYDMTSLYCHDGKSTLSAGDIFFRNGLLFNQHGIKWPKVRRIKRIEFKTGVGRRNSDL